MNLELEGKVALVTGAARDVGREIALALAAEGATIAVNYNSSADEANAVVDQINADTGIARAYQADVGDRGSVQNMVDGIVRDLGGIDILVNNAGLVLPKRFLESTPGSSRPGRRPSPCFLHNARGDCEGGALAHRRGTGLRRNGQMDANPYTPVDFKNPEDLRVWCILAGLALAALPALHALPSAFFLSPI